MRNGYFQKLVYSATVSVLTVAVAAFLRRLLLEHVGDMPLFITFYPAVILATLFFGAREGLMVTFLSALTSAFFFIPPLNSLAVESRADMVALALFVGAALLICLLSSRKEASRLLEAEALARRESELFYRQTLESIPGMVFTTRADGYCDYQSQQWADYTGVPVEEHLGDGWNSLLHPDDRPAAYAAWRAAVEERGPYDLEYRVRRHDGEYEWFKVIGRPIRDGAGHIVRWFGVAMNIEKLKQAEEELRMTFESIGDGFFACDASWRFFYVNAAAERLLNMRREEMEGKVLWEVFPATVGTKLDDEYRRAAKGEVADFENFYEPWRRWFHNRCFPREGGGISVYFTDITSSKQSQDALRLSEEKFRSFFEHAAIGMGRVSFTDAHWIDVNDAFCAMLGYSREEMLRIPWTEITHPHDVSGDLIPFREMAAGRLDSYTVEKRFIHKQGRHVWARLTLSLVRDAQGRADYEIAIIENITERKKTEEALRESEERFRTLANNISQLVWMADATGQIFWFNQRWLEYTGAGSQQTLEQQWKTIHHPDFLPSVLAKFRKSVEAGEEWEDTFPLRGKDGIYRWFLSRAIPIKDNAGRVIRWFGTNTDVTAARESAESLRRRVEELEKLMDLAPVAIWVSEDPDCRVIKGNRMANAFYEADADENVSASATQQRRYFMNGREVAADELPMQQAAVQNVDVMNETLDVLLPSGRWRYMIGSASPLRDADGQVRGCLGAFLDITQRRQAEEDLKRLVDNLARSNRDLQQFAYVASHDLQEPLRQVIAFVQLLHVEYEGSFDERAREYMGFVIDGAKRMQGLIQDLLAYSRVESGGRKLETVSVDSVLEQAMYNLRLAIEESEASITSDSLPVVQADKSQLVQVFQNLLGNALKFRGDGAPVIHVGAVRDDRRWVFSVRDNGIGFPQQQAEKIFQLFQRLHNREQYDGTGIGLTVCKRVIERHGGQIWAESQPGGGSTFYFTLPSQEGE